MEDDDGNVAVEDSQIANTISFYYLNLFKATTCADLNIVEEALQRRISDEMNQYLVEIPRDEDIMEAVFSIHADKAPDPDGFSAGFYHSFWDIIKQDVYRDIRNIFVTSTLHLRQNEAHVRLIPKGTKPRKVSDYRPIALCTTHYKIIAKIFTKRLQPLLDKLIFKHQSAFVPNRAIMDKVLITHEVLHFLRTSRAKVRCCMAIKTDISKAYDQIEWSFL